MTKLALTGAVLGLALGSALVAGAVSTASAQEPKLSEEAFEHSKTLYFQRCAGCHGALRKGATGKNLEPKNTRKLGQERLEKIITLGTEGGMNNFDDVM
ncbi:MAG TPA: cytochrome c, partial [Hyphomicrobiales bacterium]|nr:cytochrome c [Hyphomicrobiales bacterium]